MPLGLAAALEDGLLVRSLLTQPWVAAIDYKLYRAAAVIGAQQGWNRIYDRRLQFSAIAPLWPLAGWPAWWHAPDRFWTPFVNPPPVAWLAAPLNAIPAPAAAAVWMSLLGAAMVAATLLIAPPDWLSRLRYGSLLLFGWIAVLAAVSGNVVVLVGLGVVVAWRLLEAGHDAIAGIVLGAASLKPQVMLLVPLLLLACGRRRAFLAWAATAALLALASVLSVGAHGVQDYLQLARFVSTFPGERGLSLAGATPVAAGSAVIAAAAVALVGGAAWRLRSRGPAVPVALGLVGSLLLSPYLNTEDFVLLLFATMLLLRLGLGPAASVLAVALALSATTSSQEWLLPEFVAAFALLALLAFARLPAQPAQRQTTAAPG